MNAPTILTGDRPTGPLHLGHFVGSLRQRVALQQTHSQFVLIADLQGLTDNGSNPQKIRDNIPEVLADYLAAGIDPVYFGLIFVLNGTIGLITPPVGTVLNVVAGVGRLSMHQVIKGVNPFLLSYTLVLALFVIFPQIVTAPVAWMR